jgi:bifunctional non-homologous end joining protein LigD
VVLKRLSSPYLPLWLKVKHERTQDVVIGGWIPGQGARAPLLGSLLLGVQGSAGLQYCGKAGTGFTGAALLDLTRALRTLEQAASPFASPVPAAESRHAHWVRPVLAGEVAYAEWTPAGRLRHPAWRGLRADKDPAYVYREQLQVPQPGAGSDLNTWRQSNGQAVHIEPDLAPDPGMNDDYWLPEVNV